VLRETASDSPVEFVSEEQARQEGYEDLPRRRPSTEKLFQLTGFRATQDLAAIIRDCVREERRRG